MWQAFKHLKNEVFQQPLQFLAQVDIKFDSGSYGIVWSSMETINLLISIQNVEKWSQHEEERKDKAASWGTQEDAETFPSEGHVLPR